MKKLYTFFTFIMLCLSASAQWSANPSANLSIATENTSDIITKETSSGKTFIAFYTPNGSGYNMRAQLIDSAGNKLLGDSGVLVSARKSGSATFVFNTAVDNSNDLIIAMQYQKKGTYYIVAYKIDTLGNNLWGKNNKGVTLGQGLGPSVAALKNGAAIVTWQNDTGVISYQKISAKGSKTWDTAKTIIGAHSVARPQVISNPDQSFTILYQSVDIPPFYTHLYSQRFSASGDSLWPASLQLSNAVTSSFTSYSFIGDADTAYVGYYANPANQNRFNGYVQRINPDGTLPWGINGTAFNTYSGASDPYTFNVNITHAKGADHIWAMATMSDFNQVNYGISLQKFSTVSGARLLGPHAKTVFAISDTIYQEQGTLKLCTDEPLFIFTDVSNALYASKLDSVGNFAWSTPKLPIGTSLNQKSRFALTKSINNQAIAVWQEDKGNGDMGFAQNIGCGGQTGALPISLLNFTGVYNNGISNLTWQTNNETDNAGFEVERSIDGISFSAIGYMQSLAPHGFSTHQLTYHFADAKAPGGNIYYRLKQEDLNGNFVYSNAILLHTGLQFTASLYPNPVQNLLNITLHSAVSSKTNFAVTDMLGRTVISVDETIAEGNNIIKINCASLPSGIYFIRTTGENNLNVGVHKFVKE